MTDAHHVPTLADDYAADDEASALPPGAVGLTMFDVPGSEDGSVRTFRTRDAAARVARELNQ